MLKMSSCFCKFLCNVKDERSAFQEEEKLAGKGAPLLPRFGLLETRISASLDAIEDFDLSV